MSSENDLLERISGFVFDVRAQMKAKERIVLKEIYTKYRLGSLYTLRKLEQANAIEKSRNGAWVWVSNEKSLTIARRLRDLVNAENRKNQKGRAAKRAAKLKGDK